ncbi:multiple cyclophane-containing RiPP AmcA [Streptomyces sp. NPDC007983]|uniref:multiple cyclophane-containing RiPP AmcA n=1 Tax=Streptomyces sp. NPDC007983 TaxID=3364800 RepID=UPI0036EF0FD7
MSGPTAADLVLASAGRFRALVRQGDSQPAVAMFDNRPTWANSTPTFDNRPTWDNWNKKK